ncbi:MAG: hypothetical protein AAF653_13315, partial [Chloroflexota bacterium]
DRQIFPFVLFPASLLFFSVQQNLNWIIVYHGVWFHVQFLILLAATLVIFTRNQRNGLIAALVLTVIATFSHGAGAVGWGVLLLAMLFNGYRRPAHYAAWLVTALVAVSIYIAVSGVGIITQPEDDIANIDVSNIGGAIVHALVIIGSPFSGDRVTTGIVIGAGAAILLLLSLAVLYFSGQRGAYFRLWLPVMAYTAGTALLIGLARNSQSFGWHSALNSYYTTVTNFFWIGFVVAVALLIARVMTRQTWWNYSAMLANLIFCAGLLVLFVPSHTTKLDKLWDRTRFEHEGCFMRILYLQDKPRIQLEDQDCELISQDAINHLSLFNLGMMAHKTPVNILPPTFNAETPVLIEGDTGWGNYNVEKWLLDGVDELHITPTAPDSPYTTVNFDFTEPGDRATQSVLDAMDDGPALWVVRRTELDTTVPQLWAELDERGYVPTSYTY